MRNYLAWIGLGFIALELIRVTYRAFSLPWRWTVDQSLFVFLIACVSIGAFTWGTIWKREGRTGLQKRWVLIEKARSDRPSGRWGMQIAVWVVIALALMVFFSWKQGVGSP